MYSPSASAVRQLLVAVLLAVPPRPPLPGLPPHGMRKCRYDVPVHNQRQQEVHCVQEAGKIVSIIWI